MTTTLDRRRLADGSRALAEAEHTPETAEEIRAQLEVVGDGIAALQSLDDLGSDEANASAARDHDELWVRYRALKKSLEEMGTP